MCGIFGYYNFNVTKDLKSILDILFTGLKRLEYRGYDSAGLCVDSSDAYKCSIDLCNTVPEENCIPEENDDELLATVPYVVKSEGKVEALEKMASEFFTKNSVDLSMQYKNHVGIAHTRWATHGSPSISNSHPQVSDAQCEFVVIHNGIITNYRLLKEFLIKQGETFVSETDTEVIPKLCKYVYHRLQEPIPFPKLVMEILKKLEGAYALLIKSVHYPGELVACKRGSPLILGVKESLEARRFSFTRLRDYSERRWRSTAMECWVASDASAVVEYTKKVVILEDGDVLHLSGGGYGIYNTSQSDVEEAVPRVLQTLQMEVEQIMKGEYEHYMQKEIHEQPESLQLTMRGRVLGQQSSSGRDAYLTQRVKLGGLVDYVQTIRRSRRIMFVACGTSYHGCLAARSTMEEMCEVPVVLELASDLLDRRCPIFRDDTCVFVSQSGETADTMQALEYAKTRGALCLGITNGVGSGLSRATHCGVHLNAGPEIGVASTKSYTSQIVCITMIALMLAEDSISKRVRRDHIIDQLGILPAKIRQVLALDDKIQKMAKELKDEHSVLFFARGYNYATALEAALKMKEVALVHSEGMLAGEMKHGPLALVDERLPVFVIATKDNIYKKMESVIQQLLARGASLYIICNEGDANIELYEKAGCRLIQVPEIVDCLQPVVNIVPLQLLAYHLTVLRGHNVDQPRNLAKSVTVTEELDAQIG